MYIFTYLSYFLIVNLLRIHSLIFLAVCLKMTRNFTDVKLFRHLYLVLVQFTLF
jgi:hypothetical protein